MHAPCHCCILEGQRISRLRVREGENESVVAVEFNTGDRLQTGAVDSNYRCLHGHKSREGTFLARCDREIGDGPRSLLADGLAEGDIIDEEIVGVRVAHRAMVEADAVVVALLDREYGGIDGGRLLGDCCERQDAGGEGRNPLAGAEEDGKALAAEHLDVRLERKFIGLTLFKFEDRCDEPVVGIVVALTFGSLHDVIVAPEVLIVVLIGHGEGLKIADVVELL